MSRGIEHEDLMSIKKINKSLDTGKKLFPDDLILGQSILVKYVVVSAVSHFEVSIRDDIKNFFIQALGDDYNYAINFINKTILDKGFYSLFDWGENPKSQINSFLKKFFGEKMGNNKELFHEIGDKIGDHDDLKWSIRIFYYLINLRKNIVHGDLHSVNIGANHTLEEIVGLYQDSRFFIDNFKYILDNKLECIPTSMDRQSFLQDIDLKYDNITK
jgi:hypothetical protein